MIWPGRFQTFRHNQDNLITRNLYVIQIQTPNSVKHKTIANLWEIWQSWPNIKKPFFQMRHYILVPWFFTKLNVHNWQNYNLPQFQSKILFPSQWLLEQDQCTFHDKIWHTFRYGKCTFSLLPPSMKLMGFKSISWQLFVFCKERDKWTTNMLIFFHIGCTWLGVCGSTISDFLKFNKIGVDTNILSMAGYQTLVGQTGTTLMPSALFCFTFERNRGMIEIGGNAWNFKSDQSILKASIYIALG